MIWLTEREEKKGVTDAMNVRQRISPLYTGGGVNTGGVAGANEGPGQERPTFYTWWFVKRERRREDADGRIRRVCAARERVRRRGTATFCD